MKRSLLVEIGTEEIPDWMIPEALGSWGERFIAWYEAAFPEPGRKEIPQVSLDATPRRLVLRVNDLPDRQPDREEWVLGPPAAAAFKDGQPTGAAIGFARKMDVPVEALTLRETPKGAYLGVAKTIPGRLTRDLLSESLPSMVLGIYFPKTMVWNGKGTERFIRPIRWVVALLDDDIIPCRIAGVQAGNLSSGHRRLGAPSIPVSIAGYERQLEDNFVLVSSARRRQRMESGIAELLAGTSLQLKPDPSLLETLVNITEYPTPILGGFDPSYLELPGEVLVTVMRHHQKYLSVIGPDGRVAPRFIAVMNTASDPKGLVRQGNERVLRARFNDARFFLSVDRQKKLEERIPSLAAVTFHARLGSYLDKAHAIAGLAAQLAETLGLPPDSARRAALLAKCDLTTEMVKEFTELQGVIGGLYARQDGEPEVVWRAVYEHYLPQSMEDPIPATPLGRVLSLADKADTLRRSFAIGMVPTGSRDPFALRRAAQGVIKILVDGSLAVPLSLLTGDDAQLRDFYEERIRFYFREILGFRYDEVNAVLAAGYDPLPDALLRLQAIQAVRPTPDFEPLAAGLKRVQNILRQFGVTQGGEVDVALLEDGPERALYDACAALTARVEQLRAAGNYRPALEAVASLRPQVDLFFDKVLVNAPDLRLRQNRLRMLFNLFAACSSIACFSEIVTGSPAALDGAP